MNIFSRASIILAAVLVLQVPAVAFADTPTLTVQSLAPGATVGAKSMVSFSVAAAGLVPVFYQVSDSVSGSSISSSNISPSGYFSWTPSAADAGVHTITVTARDSQGTSATVTQTITVTPAASVSIVSVAPGSQVMPGTRLTFVVVPSGFTNPQIVVSDDFSGSSIVSQDIDASGNFAWTPDLSQNGQHNITVYVYDYTGHSAQASVPILVGTGPTLSVQQINPGTVVSPGGALTFIAVPNNYVPNAFTVSDSFTGSTVSNSNISTSGSFYWIPQPSDFGYHTITITGTVGIYGQSASTTQLVTVLGPGGAVPATTSVPVVTPAAPAVTEPAPAATYVFKKFISFGQDGTEVTELQKRLVALGYLTAKPNGHFGKATLAAVKKFQIANGLTAAGYVGPGTRAALNK